MLQNLRIRINRLRRMGAYTEELLLELQKKEKKYGRGKQERPPGAYLATNQIFTIGWGQTHATQRCTT